MSLAQLAKRCWCSKSSLERYLNGKIFPAREVVAAISDACGGDTPAMLALWERAWAAREVEEQPNRDIPRQLPPDVRGFTGRAAELSQLDGLFAEPDAVDAVPLAAITGTAGVGKTALAVRWARRIAPRFPDGQLWVNLRGYDPERPVSAQDALTGFLRALGVPGPDIPLDPDGQAGLYRSLLTDRRVLVVLDNASSAEQVRPLLPGAPSCLVLVTSRDDLAGLVARDGATRLRLDLLTPPDSVALLRRLLRPAEPDTAVLERLAELCARLPLALRIAAERVSAVGGQSLGEMTEELKAESSLDALAAGSDPRSAMREVFSWSYRALSPAEAALFGRLGLVPGTDWDDHAAAALADCSVTEARRLLAALAEAHLIEHHHGGRHQMHDLLRTYARERAESEDGSDAALGRLLDRYLHSAATAMDMAFAYESYTRPRIPALSRLGPDLADARQALEWLDIERSNLLAVAAYAAGHDRLDYVGQLAATLYRYLVHGAHHRDAYLVHTLAASAATGLQDHDAEARALHGLGGVYLQLGRHDEAFDHYRRALSLRRKLGDRSGQAVTLGNLGMVYWRWARYDEAATHYQQAVLLAKQIGDRGTQGKYLDCLASVYDRWGRYKESFECRSEALDIFRDIGNGAGEAAALANLGDLCERSGNYEQAFDHYRQALNLSREIGDLIGEAATLDDLGRLYQRWERYDEALAHHEQALTIFRQFGHRTGEATALGGFGSVLMRVGRHTGAFDAYARALTIAREHNLRGAVLQALNGLGEASRAIGRTADALTNHQGAVALAGELGDRYERARALHGLARAERDLGHHAMAVQHSHEALECYAEVGAPEAEMVRAELEHFAGNANPRSAG